MASKFGGVLRPFFYPLNGQFYLGRQANEALEVNQGARGIHDMVRPSHGSGENVIGDQGHFFTSIPLVEELLTHNLTYVGTRNCSHRSWSTGLDNNISVKLF